MAPREQFQVLVVDENPLTRFGISSVVNLHPFLHVCEEAADARSARAAHAAEVPHIVILDILLPHGDGIELVREFSSCRPKCRPIVVSDLVDSPTIRRAFQAGALAYISKKDEAAQILCALEAVLSGTTYTSKIVSETLQAEISRKTPGRIHKLINTLSNRELHVFRRLARNQGTTAIARELSVSVKTVETHLSRIKEKLHLESSVQLHHVAESWWASLHGQ